MSTEQELINLMFECVMVAKYKLGDKTPEELAEWVRRQLALSGYETEPIGSLWGVLIK